jgi:hypothetical protein
MEGKDNDRAGIESDDALQPPPPPGMTTEPFYGTDLTDQPVTPEDDGYVLPASEEQEAPE